MTLQLHKTCAASNQLLTKFCHCLVSYLTAPKDFGGKVYQHYYQILFCVENMKKEDDSRKTKSKCSRCTDLVCFTAYQHCIVDRHLRLGFDQREENMFESYMENII